jgi:hypothetical protein
MSYLFNSLYYFFHEPNKKLRLRASLETLFFQEISIFSRKLVYFPLRLVWIIGIEFHYHNSNLSIYQLS